MAIRNAWQPLSVCLALSAGFPVSAYAHGCHEDLGYSQTIGDHYHTPGSCEAIGSGVFRDEPKFQKRRERRDYEREHRVPPRPLERLDPSTRREPDR